MSNRPRLRIIIINWNSGNQLRRCIESIEITYTRNYELEKIVVVDNASSDRSDTIEELKQGHYEVIRNQINVGFAAACNQGARNSKTEYLLFVNPDIILCETSLDEPIKMMEGAIGQDIGICGIQLLDTNGEISRSCAYFPSLWNYVKKAFGLEFLFGNRIGSHFMIGWDHKESAVVDQVMGAFFLIRTQLFKSLGGFDERFFLYYEEVDLTLRALKAGWSSYYLATTQAYHRGCGTTDQIKSMRLFYSLRSRILYGYKHYGCLQATFLAFISMVVEPISRLLAAIIGAAKITPKEICKAYLLLWRFACEYLMKI